MTAPLGTYSFLPWLRQGIANRIGAGGATATRATVAVDLELTAQAIAGGELSRAISRTVELYGPGDVVGVDPRAIVRTEPRDWITNFEPNYLRRSSSTTRTSPGATRPGPRRRHGAAAPVAGAGRAEPRTSSPTPRSLAGRCRSVTVTPAAPLPAADEAWAWAHVHVNRSLLPTGAATTSDDMAAVLPLLEAALPENPDLGLLAARLPAQAATREPGVPRVRRAAVRDRTARGPRPRPGGSAGPRALGLGSPTRAGRAAEPAVLLPLVLPHGRHRRLRVPRAAAAATPGRPARRRAATWTCCARAPTCPRSTTLHSAACSRLGGALQVPREVLDQQARDERDRLEHWAEPYPHPFQRALADLVDLADDYAAQAAATANRASNLGPGVQFDPDPLVVPPIYGRWHARTARLLRARDGAPVDPDANWVHELNLDPRHRVTAGLGTAVVQDGQEAFMDAAW